MSQALAPAKSRDRIGAEEDRHAGPGRCGDLHGAVAGRLAQPGGEPLVIELAQPLVGGARRAARSVASPAATASGLPGERPRLVDVARRGDPLHQLARAAVGGRRQAAAEHLAHHGQVGLDAEQLLGAAAGDPEAGDHLVEDQQRARLGGRVAEELEEARLPAGPRPCWPATGSAITAAGCARRDRVRPTASRVVPGHDHRVRGLRLGDAGAGRDARRRQSRAGLGEQPVGVAVVGAGELDDRARGR